MPCCRWGLLAHGRRRCTTPDAGSLNILKHQIFNAKDLTRYMRGGEVNATAEPASLYSPSWISVLSLSVSAPVSSLAASVWLCLCVALLTLLMWMPLCVLCAAVDAPVCAALCYFFSFRVYIVTTVEIVIATDRGMQHDDGVPDDRGNET